MCFKIRTGLLIDTHSGYLYLTLVDVIFIILVESFVKPRVQLTTFQCSTISHRSPFSLCFWTDSNKYVFPILIFHLNWIITTNKFTRRMVFSFAFNVYFYLRKYKILIYLLNCVNVCYAIILIQRRASNSVLTARGKICYWCVYLYVYCFSPDLHKMCVL